MPGPRQGVLAPMRGRSIGSQTREPNAAYRGVKTWFAMGTDSEVSGLIRTWPEGQK